MTQVVTGLLLLFTAILASVTPMNDEVAGCMTFGIYLIASITGAYVTKNKWKNHLYDLIFSFVHGMFYFLCLTIWKMLYVRTLQVGLANFVMPGIYILTAFAVSCLKK